MWLWVGIGSYSAQLAISAFHITIDPTLSAITSDPSLPTLMASTPTESVIDNDLLQSQDLQ